MDEQGLAMSVQSLVRWREGSSDGAPQKVSSQWENRKSNSSSKRGRARLGLMFLILESQTQGQTEIFFTTQAQPEGGKMP